jgi:integrase
MARMTNISITALKPQAKRYEVSDPQQRGLRITVHPGGTKTFIVRYRYGGKSKKLTLASGITLEQARKLAGDAMFEVARGNDPAQQKAAAKAAAQSDTVRGVCEEFLTREGGKMRSADKYRRILQRLVYPEVGTKPIGHVRRRDVVRLLDKIEDENGPAQATIVLAIVRRTFAWHAARSDDFNSPIVRGMSRTRASDHRRKRILHDDEIRCVWVTASATPGPFGYYVKFLLLTACRREEAAAMHWSEISDVVWTLPASRNKVKQDLSRPLSIAALDVLSAVPRIHGSDFVFSGDGGRLGGIGRRKIEFDAACGVSDWVLHDLRRTARSLMSRAGVPSEHAERCLGHLQPSIQQTYDRHKYIAEMAIAYEKLAALISQIVDRQPNVVALGHNHVAVR